ncbi:long-chain-fatty-acid--CoA ligase [Nocardia sp. NPDC060220]|uniref:long-chain-fatty-acid--CoA ligase n=1 Tax=Nocardia sp. NPDC060220 TaxID=3347076 RepID=UPI00364710BE
MNTEVSNAPLSPLAFLERAEYSFGRKVAVVSDERKLTYHELAQEVRRVASALREAGIGTEDRVAYLCQNTPEMVAAHFAVPMTGAALVAVNTRLSPEEIRYILDHSGSRVLVVHSTLLELVRPVIAQLQTVEQLIVIGAVADLPGTIPVRDYDELVGSSSAEPLPASIADELAPIAVNYTSGTTGKPKGVVYTHRGAYLNALGEIVHSGFDSNSVYLWTLPMFHCNGWCTVWAVTAIGGTHVCLPIVDPTEIWRLIDAENVTHLDAAPTVLVSIANAEQAHRLTRPLTITTAGAPPSPTIIGQLEELGARLVHVYGLTETYGPYAVCEVQDDWRDLDPGKRARLMSRQGVGMVQTDGLRVVDDEMNDVPADGATMGEIVMRGNNVMAGYLDDPDATAEAFRGGWFHSGDLGVLHPDGYVELRDRAKDIVISGGENISTVEVEHAILAHPAVLETAVVPAPDEKWGERPIAFVVLRADGIATENDIIDHVRALLARFKAPDRVEFVTAMPKTATGKIRKFELKARAWTGHDVHIKG